MQYCTGEAFYGAREKNGPSEFLGSKAYSIVPPMNMIIVYKLDRLDWCTYVTKNLLEWKV